MSRSYAGLPLFTWIFGFRIGVSNANVGLKLPFDRLIALRFALLLHGIAVHFAYSVI